MISSHLNLNVSNSLFPSDLSLKFRAYFVPFMRTTYPANNILFDSLNPIAFDENSGLITNYKL
jgi:hypothetical protein